MHACHFELENLFNGEEECYSNTMKESDMLDEATVMESCFRFSLVVGDWF